jgi:hypothetical protein
MLGQYILDVNQAIMMSSLVQKLLQELYCSFYFSLGLSIVVLRNNIDSILRHLLVLLKLDLQLHFVSVLNYQPDLLIHKDKAHQQPCKHYCHKQ